MQWVSPCQWKSRSGGHTNEKGTILASANNCGTAVSVGLCNRCSDRRGYHRVTSGKGQADRLSLALVTFTQEFIQLFIDDINIGHALGIAIPGGVAHKENKEHEH